jgi:ankyrin repeat protein
VVQTGIADLQLTASTIIDTSLEIKSDTTALRDDTAVRHKLDLMGWICPVDYHVQHRDFVDRHQTGTGQWFLQDAKFQGWNQSKDATLFCPGIPGAGKTIMAALVIDHLLRSQHVADEPVTFIYCNYKRQSEQSAKHMLSSILRQIVDIQFGIPKLVQDFYTPHTAKRTTPSPDEIEQVLGAASKGLQRLTIIVDALDECETRARQQFLSADNVRYDCWQPRGLFLPSSPTPPSRANRRSRSRLLMKIWRSISGHELVSCTSELCRSLNYSRTLSPARSVLLEECMLNLFYDQSKKEITDNIHTRFLLAQLLMDSFRDKLTVRDVKSALRNLPQGSDAYDVAYHAAMERILTQGEGASKMAKKILAWVLCAHRPLSTLELLHALAVEPGDDEIDEDNIMETEQLLTICAGLVTIDEQSDSVRFIHYTTQEYLQRNQQTWLPHAEIEIARSCTAYLSIDGLLVDLCSSEVDYESRLKKFVLLKYAAVYWGPHLNSLMGTCEFDLLNGVGTEALSLLLDTDRLSVMSQVLFMSRRRNYPRAAVKEEGKGFCGSHWTGRFGLLSLLEQWIDKKYETDQRDLSGRTPLSWAAENGQVATTKLLLDKGKVDVDSKDNDGRTPLWWAIRNGKEVITKLLLGTGKVDVDSKDNDGRTPLSWAAANGQEAILKLLLDTGKVDVDSKDNDGWTPLSWAAEKGREVNTKLLLDTGKADVDSEDNNGRTPLWWTIGNGNEAITKLLLDTGKVDVDSKDNYGRTLLSWAAEKGREATTKLLLDTGKVDVDSKDNDGRTPLWWAIRNGKEVITKLLLGTGKVDVDSKDSDGWTPLWWAAGKGQEATTKLLLGTGKVDVDSKDSDGWTPLWWAIRNGREATTKLLLDTGKVDVDSKDNDGRTPLSWAAANGQEAILKQLLDTGKVDVDSKDNYGRTPLSWATKNRHRRIAMSLIEKSSTHDVAGAAGVANNNEVVELTFIQRLPDFSPDAFGRTPYMWAALGGHITLIQSHWPSCFPTSCSVFTKTDNLGLSLIHFFAIGNCAEGVSLMLDAGSNVNETDSQAWTPLHWAAYFGHGDVADVLLRSNADTSLMDLEGWTPYELSIFVGDSAMAHSLKDSAKDPCSIDFQEAQPLRGQCDACSRVSHALIALYTTYLLNVVNNTIGPDW